MQKYKLGDYIVLSNEGINILAKRHNISPKSIKKIVRKVIRIEKGINDDQKVCANKSKIQNKAPIGNHLFRLATQTEIRKQKIKDIFLPVDETDEDKN